MQVRYLVPAALAALMVAGGFGVTARPARAQEQPTGIRVTGRGTVSARPDVAFLTIGATVRRETPGAAFERAEQLIGALVMSLRANGVEERDIQDRQFSLTPEFGRAAEGQPPPVVAWRAVHLVTVKIRAFDRIGRIVGDAVAALGDEATIQGLSFGIENTEALAAQARVAAIDNARAIAEQMAARAGVRVGRVVYMQETSAPPPTPMVRVAAPVPVAATAFEAQVSPGELSVTVTVEMIFEIA